MINGGLELGEPGRTTNQQAGGVSARGYQKYFSFAKSQEISGEKAPEFRIVLSQAALRPCWRSWPRWDSPGRQSLWMTCEFLVYSDNPDLLRDVRMYVIYHDKHTHTHVYLYLYLYMYMYIYIYMHTIPYHTIAYHTMPYVYIYISLYICMSVCVWHILVTYPLTDHKLNLGIIPVAAMGFANQRLGLP